MSPLVLLILCLALLLLFANRLPAAMPSLGRGMLEFLHGIAEFRRAFASTHDNGDDPPTASGVFAPIQPHPSGGTAAREHEPGDEGY